MRTTILASGVDGPGGRVRRSATPATADSAGHCDHPRHRHRLVGRRAARGDRHDHQCGHEGPAHGRHRRARRLHVRRRSSPAPTTLKVELEGFKTYERQGHRRCSPQRHPRPRRPARGRLPDRGHHRHDARSKSIQTETGAREGVLTAEQIDNLSVVGRSSLELLRILPGVVAPDNTAFESVSFGGGANNTQGYTVNGIRSSNNTVSLDGSALIDIGSNSGVIVTLNNDMVQEVKVQSSNFAAEYGAGGMNVSAVTKAGSSQFHGTLYDYNRDSQVRGQRPLEQHRRASTKPKSKFNYPGGNIGGPILIPGADFNKNRNKVFFFVGLEVAAPEGRPGRALRRRSDARSSAQGDFSEFLTHERPEPRPAGRPGADSRRASRAPASRRPAPTSRRTSRRSAGCSTNLYPEPNYVDPNNQYNYVLSQLEPTNRLDMKMRVRLQHHATTPRPTSASPVRARNGRGRARRVVGRVGSRAAVAEPRHQRRPLGLGQRRHGAQPDDDQRGARVSWSRLKLDNTYKDPSQDDAWPATASRLPGPFGATSPYIPGVIPNWGGGVSNMWSAGERHVRAQRRADVLEQAHEDRRCARPEVRRLAAAPAEAAELPEQRRDATSIFAPGWTPGSTGNAVGDILTGRITQLAAQGTRAAERRVPHVELRRVRAGLVEAPSEPHARVRRPRRLLDEQRGAERPRRLLRSVDVRPERRRSSSIRARSAC